MASLLVMRRKFNVSAIPMSKLKVHLWLSLCINCCALYQNNANLIFNIVNIMTMLSKSSENENDNTNASRTQAAPKMEGHIQN